MLLDAAKPRARGVEAIAHLAAVLGMGEISTRRLRARFSPVSLGATGWPAPNPAAKIASSGTPAATSARVTVSARSAESCQLSL